ncbi:MAG: sugar phosphate isomerase/epimerase family protein [Oscillospiraceae bacterium]
MFGWDPGFPELLHHLQHCEEMLECIRLLDSEDVVCLDTGHSHLVRQPLAQEARLLGKHLKLLHVHDNCGFNDEHLAPGYGSIPWPEFLSALRDIGYDGVFSAETFRMGTAVPAEASVQAIKLVYAILDSLLRENGLR